jgi:hypothetical protein
MIPVVLLLAPAPDAQAERQKIEALILAVAQLKGAVFIRNGSEHTPQQAADHLRLKWGNAGSRVKTAQDFIRGCGTKSSFSGKPYRLRYADGRESSCSDFLWTELKKLDDTIK